MKLTNETLLPLYLKDLTMLDPTHGNRVKNRNPQYFNVQPRYLHEPLKIDALGDRDIWFWSDIHINHKNILHYAGRPYPTIDLMNKCLIGNYINVVKEDDIVFWGGDIAFGDIKAAADIIGKLPGYKIQIIGNHDMSNSGVLRNYPFEERHPCYVLDVEDAETSYQLLLTHYPLDNLPDNCISIHGHIHQHPAPTARHVNISVEHTNYAPKHISEILVNTHKTINMLT